MSIREECGRGAKSITEHPILVFGKAELRANRGSPGGHIQGAEERGQQTDSAEGLCRVTSKARKTVEGGGHARTPPCPTQPRPFQWTWGEGPCRARSPLKGPCFHPFHLQSALSVQEGGRELRGSNSETGLRQPAPPISCFPLARPQPFSR